MHTRSKLRISAGSAERSFCGSTPSTCSASARTLFHDVWVVADHPICGVPAIIFDMNMVNSASTWSSLRISRSSSLPGVAVVSFLAFERHGVGSEKITRPAGIIS